MDIFLNSFFGKIIRWLLFLPGSILALFAAYLLVGIWRWTSTLFLGMGETWLDVLVGEILANFLAGGAFVTIGTIIAPDYKKIISVILTILLISICLFGLFGAGLLTYFAYLLDFNILGEFKFWINIIALIATGVGAVYATIQIFKDVESVS